MLNIRKAVVAGKFYPGDKESIKKQIETILKKKHLK
jgi:AmmeMemoRadiSam system protein B